MVFGSDAPVESPDPFLGLFAAMERAMPSQDPNTPSWIPEEMIDIETALCAYIENPPKAVGWADRLGRLDEGYFADLIVLDRDPYKIPSLEIPQIKVEGVMTGGTWRFLKI